MSGFTWLNELMVWLGRWVPRLLLIPPTHHGVRFGPTGRTTRVGPGLILYWPITHEIVQIPITLQSVQLCAQLLPCDRIEGELLPRVKIVATAIQYRVTDAVQAATVALSLHALIDNRASAAIARHVGLGNDLTTWAEAVRRDTATECEPFGVVVERLDFTSNGIGVALKNVSDWTYADNATGKREV